MKRNTIIALLLLVVIFMMASERMPILNKKKAVQADTTAVTDTTKLDSIGLAIYHHNKQVDDSIRLDSINKKKSSDIYFLRTADFTKFPEIFTFSRISLPAEGSAASQLMITPQKTIIDIHDRTP